VAADGSATLTASAQSGVMVAALASARAAANADVQQAISLFEDGMYGPLGVCF
jgi:hypothetical protein